MPMQPSPGIPRVRRARGSAGRTGLVLLLALGRAFAQEAPVEGNWRDSLDRARDRLADRLLGVKANAFADVLSAPDDQGRRKVDWGSAELDLAKEFGDHLDAAAALVWTRESTRLTVGFLDIHPFGGTIAPRGRLWVEKGFHLQAGRFDVPFGNDWQFFASKDSTSISRPLATDRIMDGGYNDAGIRVLGNDGTANFNFYVLRGFSAGRLVGGRIGLTPFGNPFSLKGSRDPKTAEFGASYLFDTTSDGRKRQAAFAVDAEGRIGDLYLRSEYVARDRVATENGPEQRQRGWHLSPEYALGEALPWPVTLFGRYEHSRDTAVDPALPPGDDQDRRVCLGFSANFGGLVQLKAEVQRYLSATAATRASGPYGGRVYYLQMVVVL